MTSILVKNTFTLWAMTPTAKRIFELAEEQGISDRSVRSTLAKVCGVSPQAIRDWSDGSTKNIKEEHLVAVAKFFKVSTDYLLTGRNQTPALDPESAELFELLEDLPGDERSAFVQMLRRAKGQADA